MKEFRAPTCGRASVAPRAPVTAVSSRSGMEPPLEKPATAPREDAAVPSVRLFVARLETDMPACEASAWHWLSAQEQARANRFIDRHARARHVIGRSALRLIAAAVGGADPRAVEVAEAAGGKPFLPAHPRVHTSVSHTGAVIVVALSFDVRVGVDIEDGARSSVRSREIAARFFAADEAQRLARLPEPAYHRRFLRHWTVKEAVGKALGQGIGPALAGVVVDATPGAVRLVSVLSGPPARLWSIHAFDLPGGELVAIASPAAGVSLSSLHNVTADHLSSGRLPSL